MWMHLTCEGEGRGGVGSCLAAASIADTEASATAHSLMDVDVVECVFAPIVPRHYLAGYASDGGKMYSSIVDAKAVCSKDARCGGTLSRSCTAASNGTASCKLF
jgi:hypothetical protein